MYIIIYIGKRYIMCSKYENIDIIRNIEGPILQKYRQIMLIVMSVEMTKDDGYLRKKLKISNEIMENEK